LVAFFVTDHSFVKDSFRHSECARIVISHLGAQAECLVILFKVKSGFCGVKNDACGNFSWGKKTGESIVFFTFFVEQGNGWGPRDLVLGKDAFLFFYVYAQGNEISPNEIDYALIYPRSSIQLLTSDSLGVVEVHEEESR